MNTSGEQGRGRARSGGIHGDKLAAHIAGVHRAVRTCGRPRDPAVDEAIISAAMELLAEEGFEGMSIKSIAHRAGVGKPAIYRRWPSKRDLVIELLEQIADRPEMPAGGTVRERITAFMSDWCQRMRTDKGMQFFSSLISEVHRDPELGHAVLRAFITNRKMKMMAALKDGIASGEIPADTDIEAVVDMLLGAVVSRRLMSKRALSATFGRQIVDIVFSGCCGKAGKTPRS